MRHRKFPKPEVGPPAGPGRSHEDHPGLRGRVVRAGVRLMASPVRGPADRFDDVAYLVLSGQYYKYITCIDRSLDFMGVIPQSYLHP